MSTKTARASKAPSTTANAEDAAPDLSSIHDAVMVECAALLLIKQSFSEFGQIQIGHTITDDDADVLAAINGGLHACRKRLVGLSLVTDDASVNYVLVPNEYERARLRLVSREGAAKSRASEISARVAACKAKARAVMAELDALAGELPKVREDEEEQIDKTSEKYVLSRVRDELQMAAGTIDGAIDYLTANSSDSPDDPGNCCAHRLLQALIARQGELS